MKLQVAVALSCLISLIWVQHILCDEVSDTSTINKWTCTCSAAYQGNQSFAIETNCSTSCDCSPAGSSKDSWICMCGSGFPEVAAGNLSTSCFTACNCTSGLSSQLDSSKKKISSKVVVIILSICVLLMTLAFMTLVICYAYRRRDKSPVTRPLFSSDKETSFNSAANLISHGASSVSGSKIYIGAPAKPITGCIPNASLFFKSKRETIHGTILRFSYPELEDATNKFSNSNLIGVGGSSHVYHGHLRDGRAVAIKRLKTQGGPDPEAIFLTEIELISRLHHCHVLPLLGYCSEIQGKHAERLLVFEYMINGNLRECLDGASGKSLDWCTRVAIALGAAKGLEYLHEAAAPKILHRDVKSTNILLDENWRAKITDLAMAKHLRADDLPSCPSSPARMQGTFGYFAPEYAIVGRASLKSDVFSFGVVLLELISGRQPIQKSANKGEESLVIWATPRLLDSRRVIKELPDLQLKGNFPEEEMQIMAYLAKECLLLDPDSRPSMSEVVQILSTIAPEKSRRQNFPINLYQSSTYSFKGDVDIRRASKQIDSAGEPEAEEIKRVTSYKWSPLNADRTLSADENGKEANTFSAEHIDRLILLTSKARSWRSQDDEAVDITEPRFESFCMENTIST
ncbi:receptor-like serine/threonine-protein kinase NCRK isoform X1 [Actinidia eriantha]|uniref:receptor-like serine/threonine-protein kinase NCRK isoform X1 n=1 Tax=Actinidia eriantha TaxID=165200 RepID=UPI00258CDD68|nr:receptor-like serine/threonine-protein kinase NCRK isoform X1 [Actinidia eriantha]XP_057480301.1 receptor-like serine/threonine-protein kinase NCRK isoform X1 [Actinidia eriantha]XP_057480302.1 receptor-like serine/threonine-protein kinase NCRK isoform X1 [Actinidia eriantha]XP_057480303.1 receptor-like serine/threonine-protein kinase NCRK isoform X1 [Actinidia eriantha]XP_057480304.1 receptor-like serine/threonine-protein kinase NCRK isoform X1 [Actinidia eriantha]XP_057480305.1 receptor-l